MVDLHVKLRKYILRVFDHFTMFSVFQFFPSTYHHVNSCKRKKNHSHIDFFSVLYARLHIFITISAKMKHIKSGRE